MRERKSLIIKESTKGKEGRRLFLREGGEETSRLKISALERGEKKRMVLCSGEEEGLRESFSKGGRESSQGGGGGAISLREKERKKKKVLTAFSHLREGEST